MKFHDDIMKPKLPSHASPQMINVAPPQSIPVSSVLHTRSTAPPHVTLSLSLELFKHIASLANIAPTPASCSCTTENVNDEDAEQEHDRGRGSGENASVEEEVNLNKHACNISRRCSYNKSSYFHTDTRLLFYVSLQYISTVLRC